MPTATYKGLGDRIDYTPSSAVSAGDVVVMNNLVGVATEDIAANALGSLAVEGVFDFPLESGQAFTLGADVYWDATNQIATDAVAQYLGKCVKAAAADAATIRVKLVPQEAAVSGSATGSA